MEWISRRKDSSTGDAGDLRVRKTKVEERVRGAVRGWFPEELDVRVAWVPAGRVLALGRREDGGMVIVREEAVERVEMRRVRKRDCRGGVGKRMVGWFNCVVVRRESCR